MGNFPEMVNFRSANLSEFKSMLDESKYATLYLSSQYQNEIAGLLSEQVLDSISNEFANKPFSLILDETTDTG